MNTEENNPYDSPDYSLGAYTGHYKKNKPITKSLTSRFVDDESGMKSTKGEIPAHPSYHPKPAGIYPDSLGPEQDDEFINDAARTKSSTERVRKYYKRHPEKVRKYLKDTVKDRVARNRDRRKAVKKYGKSKMKNHDVHHPNGAKNGNWRLAKKDHGRDKVNEIFELVVENVNLNNIYQFVEYASKRLNIQRLPKVVVQEPEKAMTSLGSYDVVTNTIHIVTRGRLLADVLRTIAHEMAHQKQNEIGTINDPRIDGATGSPIENQANIVAGILLRDYGKMNKNIFLSERFLIESTSKYTINPFEDEKITFAGMKEMLTQALIGVLGNELPVNDKLEGQSVEFTIRDGQMFFARSKSHVKNRGKNAVDFAGIRPMFAGKSSESTLINTIRDLQLAITKIPPDQLQQLFADGVRFLTIEIILPDTDKVIPYGKSIVIIRDLVEYDESGNEVGKSYSEGKVFSDALIMIGAEQQTDGPMGSHTIAFSTTETGLYQQKLQEYFSRLDRLLQEFGLDETTTLTEYKSLWWKREIEKEIDRLQLNLTEQEVEGLISRWSHGNKKFLAKHIVDDEAKKWCRQYERDFLEDTQLQVIHPIQITFLQAGINTLQRITNVLSTNIPQISVKLKMDVLDSIENIRNSEEQDRLITLQRELERFDSIGVNNIVPSEGLVMMCNGAPYKFTSTFAPITQIIHTFKLKVPPKETTSTPTEPEEVVATESTEPTTQQVNRSTVSIPQKREVQREKQLPEVLPKRTVAIFRGRFQPFHSGHYKAYKRLVEKFGADNVFVASSNKTDSINSPFEFKDKQEIMTKMFDIPVEMIVQVKNPLVPMEILSKLPPNTTYVTIVNQRDADKLNGNKYFINFEEVPITKHKPLKEQGYFIISPEMQLSINGKNLGGKALRTIFGDPTITERAKQEIFTKVYEKFDKKMFDKIVKITTESEEARKITDLHKTSDSTGNETLQQDSLLTEEPKTEPKKLYIDDVRPTPPGFNDRAYTAQEAIEKLSKGDVEYVSFDHDLGPEEAGTGYDVAKWIEEKAYTDPTFRMPEWTIHSANPVGIKNIERAMNSADRGAERNKQSSVPQPTPQSPEKVRRDVQKKPDAATMSRARSVLGKRVRNPKTNRDILVATALRYGKEEPVRKAAELMVQRAIQEPNSTLTESSNQNIKLKVYTNIRPYTDEYLDYEVDEYFKNERTLESFPELADSSAELKDMIKTAPSEVLTREELSSLMNSDVGSILRGENKRKVLVKMMGNKKDVIGLLKDIKNEKPIHMPVVVKHTEGYYLLGGNTRLCTLASIGYTMPVKVLGHAKAYPAPFIPGATKDQKKTSSKGRGNKELFKKIMQMMITNPETGNQVKIDTAMDYDKNHPAHKLAMGVIRQHMKGISNRAGIPKNRQD